MKVVSRTFASHGDRLLVLRDETELTLSRCYRNRLPELFHPEYSVAVSERGGPPSLKAPADSLREQTERRLVTQIFTSWNQIAGWLRRLAGLRDAA